jgi:hypothetical protein
VNFQRLPETLFLEAGAGMRANLNADLLVVRAGLGQRPIAPAMGRIREFSVFLCKHLIRLGRDVHFFCAEMLADIIWLHG